MKTRKLFGALIATFIFLSASSVAILVVDRPIWDGSAVKGREERAAIAIRDNVIRFQKWGTRIFAWPYLRKHYGRVYYFTQSSTEDKEKEFKESLRTALRDYESVDIFLLTHSNSYYLWVHEIDEHLRARIRLCLQYGLLQCHARANMAQAWSRDIYRTSRRKYFFHILLLFLKKMD